MQLLKKTTMLLFTRYHRISKHAIWKPRNPKWKGNNTDAKITNSTIRHSKSGKTKTKQKSNNFDHDPIPRVSVFWTESGKYHSPTFCSVLKKEENARKVKLTMLEWLSVLTWLLQKMGDGWNLSVIVFECAGNVSSLEIQERKSK